MHLDRRRLGILSVLGALAVGSSCKEEAPLGDFPGKALEASIVLDPKVTALTLTVQYNPQDDCLTLADDAKATLDQTALEAADRGGGTFIPRAGGSACIRPTFRLADLSKLPATPPASAIFTVSDASATMKLEVANPFTERTVEKIAPAGDLHRGDAVTLQWSPATDTVKEAEVRFVLGACNQALATTAQTTIEGQTKIHFTVPASLPADCNGAGKLMVSPGAEAQAKTCEGAASCKATIAAGPELAATVAP